MGDRIVGLSQHWNWKDERHTCCPGATVVYDKPVGNHQEDYFTIQLSNATIASVQESGSSENPTESISLVGTSYTFSFKPEKDDGSLLDAVVFTGSCTP